MMCFIIVAQNKTKYIGISNTIKNNIKLEVNLVVFRRHSFSRVLKYWSFHIDFISYEIDNGGSESCLRSITLDRPLLKQCIRRTSSVN